MDKHSVIGIDLAKRSIQVCLVNTRSNKVIKNKAVSSNKFLEHLSNVKPCRLFMESCSSAHYWARQLKPMGFEVQLISPQHIVRHRIGQKTDANDALAIAEAGLRTKMNFVTVKGIEQQNLQALERVRERLVKQKTQVTNQTHGLLLEFGIVSGRGLKAIKASISNALEDAENELTWEMRHLFAEQRDEINHLHERIVEFTKRIEHYSQIVSPCKSLTDIRGVGPISAAMLYVLLGNGKSFANGRQAAANIGLTPKQYSTGGKVSMYGIGKRGNRRAKAVLIRGALAVIANLGDKQDRLSCWLRALIARSCVNKAAVALANKTVRTAWAMLRHEQAYNANIAVMTAA
jgi:transposase